MDNRASMTSFVRRKWVVASLGVLVALLGWIVYSQWKFGREFAGCRWLTERSDNLIALSEQILDYAQQHHGALPETLEEMVQLGLMPGTAVDFVDPENKIHVVRHFRPVPTTDFPGELILLIESYNRAAEPRGFRFFILRVDGNVFAYRDIAEELDSDNRLRAANGLPAIEFK